MPSDYVLQLCSSNETVASQLALNPDQEVDNVVKKLKQSWSKSEKSNNRSHDDDELDRAAKCGKFPYRPSNLFLKIYNDVLNTLEHDPFANLVSPSLMGSSGVIPLSIVSVIPDIMRHYADVIVRAESEIFLATNYWENSHSSRIITDSLRELSKRVEARNGPRVVVKLMYDRGSINQAIHNHVLVKPDEWTSKEVGLPEVEEIPFIDLEVVNYHRPLLGTFHAKYLVVDRRIACLNSNNIQDRPNMEMMVHLEGPIVEAFYDMALMSWALALNPPLPLLTKPRSQSENFKFLYDNDSLKYIDAVAASKATRKFINKQQLLIEDEIRAAEDHGDESGKDDLLTAADQAVADAIAEHSSMNVPSANTVAPGKGIAHREAEISSHIDEGNKEVATTVNDADILKVFRPHILHQPHGPCPIAMVDRKPKGTPGHYDEFKVPQNVAWLGAMKYAQKWVLIQTPTLNASPIIPAIIETCNRGVEVIIYLDLGFNDLGEMLPFQGGTNEQVVHKLYKQLNSDNKQRYLKVYWYTAKDQTKPLSAAIRKRNCHVKFMAADGQIAILGNGNQDTQSWFHSQEINIMVDSPALVDEWVQGMNINQNTAEFGQVDPADGVWRDEQGNVVEATGIKGGGLLALKGVGGAIARVRGKGGF